MIRRRKRKRPILNSLQRALRPDRFAPGEPETYLEAVDHLATAPAADVYAAFDAAMSRQGSEWAAVGEAAEEARLDEERRRHGVRKPRTEVVEEPAPSAPAYRPRSRADLDRAEMVARIYTDHLVEEQLEARRARLGGEVEPVSRLSDLARRQASGDVYLEATGDGRSFVRPDTDQATRAAIDFVTGGA
jgi:hypothetical protein